MTPIIRQLIRSLAILLLAFMQLSVWAQIHSFSADNPARIHMVVYRGCEESCMGFQRFLLSHNLPVRISVTDIARDNDKLPAILDKLITESPDLVVTWGTAVTRALVGTKEEYGRDSALGDIPVLFMIVADPVAADIIDSYDNSGRDNVTGVRNRVPEKEQFSALFSYFKPKKLGVINAPTEINSKLNTESIQSLAAEMDVEMVALEYPLHNGKADPSDIPMMMDELVAAGVDTVYVGSSSFNLQHAKAFTEAAVERHLPVFSAYESMVKDADALMSVASSYVNVGKLAAYQAEKILFHGKKPSEMKVATLDRYSIMINMRVAKALEIYPPIQLINIAVIIN